ncbi:hypothetical protein GF377_02935 [candidate division GN15 bacterium]|nr:hypothetical protein [candidate division GN15 bacterium]
MEALVVLIILAFAGLFFYIIKAHKRHKEMLRQLRSRHGFIAVPSVDQQLVDKAKAITATKSSLRLQDVYKREESGYTIYDALVKQGSDSDSDSRKFIVVGRDWDIPAFKLSPKFDELGMLGGLLGKAMQWILKRGGYQQMTIEGAPQFNKKYILVAKDPTQVQQHFTTEFWRSLADWPTYVLLEVEGDTMVFGTAYPMNRGKKVSSAEYEERRLKEVIEHAQKLDRLLSAEARERERAW